MTDELENSTFYSPQDEFSCLSFLTLVIFGNFAIVLYLIYLSKTSLWIYKQFYTGFMLLQWQ